MIIPTYGTTLRHVGKQLLQKIIPYSAAAYAGYELADIIETKTTTVHQEPPLVNRHRESHNTTILIALLLTVKLIVIAAAYFIIKKCGRTRKTHNIELQPNIEALIQPESALIQASALIQPESAREVKSEDLK